MKACCKTERTVIKRTENDTGVQITEQCKVCGMKHFRLKAKPLSIGTGFESNKN